MKAIIISVGTELTTGQTLDTNGQWLSGELTGRGIAVVGLLTVDDHRRRVCDSIGDALRRAELVVVTGGLGPTADDVTRHALAEAVGRPLIRSEEAFGQIAAFFAGLGRVMTDVDAVQAMMPEGCGILPNAHGTAPGIAFRQGDRWLFALPGVPSEMRRMFLEGVAPHLPAARLVGQTQIGILRCFGMSEAKLGAAIEDLMTTRAGVQVGTTAKDGVIGVRIVASAANPTEAKALLEGEKAEIRSRLGGVVFGEDGDTLESAVAGMLKDRAQTVSTAESCTGGLLAKRLTDLPGSSEFFVQGCVTYANRAKTDLLGVTEELIERNGAVSEPVVEAMAIGCRERARTDHAIAISGIAGPGGGNSPDKPVGLVVIGLASVSGTTVRAFRLGSHLSRAEIRDRSCKIALNLLRVRLLRDAQ